MDSKLVELAKKILKSRDDTEKADFAVDLAYEILSNETSGSSSTTSSKKYECECGEKMSKSTWGNKKKEFYNKKGDPGHDFTSAHFKGMVIKKLMPVEDYFEHKCCRLNAASKEQFLMDYPDVLHKKKTPKVRDILIAKKPASVQEEDEDSDDSESDDEIVPTADPRKKK